MRRTLEYQADQIEVVLYSHKVSGRVTGGVVTPCWVRFEIIPALGAKVGSVAIPEDRRVATGLKGTGVIPCW